MSGRWSVAQLCVVVFILCLFQSNGAFTIRNDTGLEDLKQQVDDLSRKLQIFNETLQKGKKIYCNGFIEKKKNAMFYAVIRGKSYTYNVDAKVVFETVIVNEGNHYDKYDGVFVAPVSGTYLFSWTVSGQSTNYIVTELVIESNVISSTGELNSGGGWPSGSMTALCKMKAGDHAWIRSTSVSSGHVLHSSDNYPQSGFLGMLISVD